MRRAYALVMFLAVLGGGCALFDDQRPPRTCTQDPECFQAQGEVCNPDTKLCEPGPASREADVDGGVDALTSKAIEIEESP
jgi:hypothetical protein